MGSCGNTIKLGALPKGFRFRPTDEELVNHYLRHKINGHHSAVYVIPEIDVCKWEPWDLPALSVIKSDDPEWFFFCPRDKKYPNGYRSNRATEAGYWKATGKDRTIKSCRSSSSSGSSIIGFKKTLVFYRGRAPKGERSNWVMHEYRTTGPDLDGTGSGQGDYVLCRLFHKADERLDSPKYNEAEPTGSTPSTDKSTPDDVSSDLFREPGTLDMQIIKEPEDMKTWWTDRANFLIPNLAPVENCASDGINHSGADQADFLTKLAPIESCASDGIYHSGEETGTEDSLPSKELSVSEETANNQFGNKGLSSLQLHVNPDLGASLGSPFAADFGNEKNELNFQDGTSELDASLSELLQGLQNNGYYFREESTGRMTYDVPSQSFIPSRIDVPEHAPFTSSMSQRSPCFSRVPSTNQSRSQYAVEEVDSSVNAVSTSCHKPVDMFYRPDPIKDDSNPVSETGIKIRSRQPEDRPSSMSFTGQGTAPRRMHLAKGYAPKSIYSDRSDGEENVSPPLIAQAVEDTDRTSSQKSESVNHNKDMAQKCDPTAVEKKGQNGGAKMAFLLRAAFPARLGSGYSKVYATCIHLVIILSLVFLGIWMCPRLHDNG